MFDYCDAVNRNNQGNWHLYCLMLYKTKDCRDKQNKGSDDWEVKFILTTEGRLENEKTFRGAFFGYVADLAGWGRGDTF